MVADALQLDAGVILMAAFVPPRPLETGAGKRADELEARLRRRIEELAQERQIAASSPVIIGGALIVPAGLL